MAFDPNAPSGTEATMADLWAGIRGNFGDHEDRLKSIEGEKPGELRDEVEAARGTRATLADRLATALDDDGYLRFESLKQVTWAATGLTPTYVSGTSFTVPGDAVERFPKGMTLRLDLGGGEYAYTQVSSASYDGSTATTIGVKDAVVTAGLSAVALGVAVFNSQASQVDVAEGGRLPAQDLQATLEWLDREDAALAQVQAQAAALHVETLSADTTLGAVTGKNYRAATDAVTLTLPPAAETPAGWFCRIKHRSGGASGVTIACQGGDTIGGAASVNLADGDAALIIRTSNSNFEVF